MNGWRDCGKKDEMGGLMEGGEEIKENEKLVN